MTEEFWAKGRYPLFRAQSDVPELLSLFDVFALTSKIEASPVSILEAQACGIPVVATNVGSISESVIDGQTGLLVESESVTSVASRNCSHSAVAELASSLSSAAREFVVEHRSVRRMVRGYEELIARLYEEKIERPKCPRPARIAYSTRDAGVSGNVGSSSSADPASAP